MPWALSTIAVLLCGCTANFWSLSTGIQEGEITGSIETRLEYPEGCNDLTLFAFSENGNITLELSVDGLLQQMNDNNERLKTHILEEEESFSLTLTRGQGANPCYGDYYYYDYYYYYGEDPREEPEPAEQFEQEFVYRSGRVRLDLTARRRNWDFYDDSVHTKVYFQDVTLEDPQSGETVSIPGMVMQTYIYQWYWY